MKRHASLVSLSRDHHQALILARLLQQNAPAYKGLPADLTGKAAYASEFYNRELTGHFADEEKAFSFVSGISSQLDSLIQTIVEEHNTLRRLFNALSAQEDRPEELDELGKILELHIRKEERELFPLIEQSCDEAQMTAIARLLSKA